MNADNVIIGTLEYVGKTRELSFEEKILKESLEYIQKERNLYQKVREELKKIRRL